MKKIVFLIAIVILSGTLNFIHAQTIQVKDSLGLPGDNLNLYAVMNLFRESETLEIFERKLNAEDSKVNNLDLNADDKIDYIRVVDNVDKMVHNIVLQVPINEKENQDVAVFIVEKNHNGEVQIQLIGDEVLYGKDYIIEPNYKDASDVKETPNPGYIKKSTTRNINASGNITIINNYTTLKPIFWPLVRFVFMPSYSVWISPWRYNYYPSFWHPWKPWYWHYYYGYHVNYYPNYYRSYRSVNYYRSPLARNVYYNQRRMFSVSFTLSVKTNVYRTTYAHPEMRRSGIELYQRNSNQNNRMNSSTNRVISNRNIKENKLEKVNTQRPIITDRRNIRPSENKFENKQIENKVPTNSRPIIKLENRPSENKIQQKRRENDQPKQRGFREKEN